MPSTRKWHLLVQYINSIQALEITLKGNQAISNPHHYIKP